MSPNDACTRCSPSGDATTASPPDAAVIEAVGILGCSVLGLAAWLAVIYAAQRVRDRIDDTFRGIR